MTLVHGTAVAVGRFGVLLRGPSGAGKSSLALRLIDEAGYGLGEGLLYGQLVADDQVNLTVEDGFVVARCPAALSGLLEIRGIGVVRVKSLAEVRLALIVDLMRFQDIARMPGNGELITELLGIAIKRLMIDSADPAAVAKIRSALF